MRVSCTLNGRPIEWEIVPNETLLDSLRSHGLTGTKRVCESGECGACAVIVDGLAMDSCLLLTAQIDGADVVTVEGLETAGTLHPVEAAFAENGAIQCGFCIPGMVVTAANFLEQNPHPSEDEVRHVFNGNLCRCTGYKKPIEAVLNAAQTMGEQR